MKEYTDRKIGFIQGVAYAAGLCRRYGSDSEQLLKESGIGKTLKIRAGKQEGVMIVVGYDQETKDTFVLHEEFSTSPVPIIKPGDKARHPDLGEVVVQWVGDNIAEVAVGVAHYDVPLKDLEVVE